MHVRHDRSLHIQSVAQHKEYDKMIRYLPKTLSYEAIIPWFETLWFLTKKHLQSDADFLIFFQPGRPQAVATLVDLRWSFIRLTISKELAKRFPVHVRRQQLLRASLNDLNLTTSSSTTFNQSILIGLRFVSDFDSLQAGTLNLTSVNRRQTFMQDLLRDFIIRFSGCLV